MISSSLPPAADDGADPDFMLSLARGLAVLHAFGDEKRPMTIATIAARTALSRAAARRVLHTLVKLGYAAKDDNQFSLMPKVLALGYSYLSSNSLAATAQPLLDGLRDILHESCSLGVREDNELVYIGRSETARIMSIGLRAGSRLPLYCTSMGRILLAYRPIEEQRAYLQAASIERRTARTEIDRDLLLEIFRSARERGYAIVDQELEMGLISIAVPVFDRKGDVVASVNVGSQAARVSVDELVDRVLPELQNVAEQLRHRVTL